MSQHNNTTNIDSTNEIFGVHKYLYYGQHERVDELNTRIEQRHFSDNALEPNFDPRPVPTKQILYPAFNVRKPSTVPINKYNDYDITANFNPCDRKPHFTGFSEKIDVENDLRNQFFALQKGSIQRYHIPSKDSDLYKVTVQYNHSIQPHPDLFSNYKYEKYPIRNEDPSIGKDIFSNHTRTQLRNTSM